MKLDPETREKAAQDAHAACYPILDTNWDLLSEGSRNLWRGIADAVAATIPEPAPADGPQPVDPADVREGDRVRMVVTREGVIHQDGCLVISGEHFGLRKGGATLYLLDRPDPDAALIEVMAERAARADDDLYDGEWPAGFPGADAYRTIARAALAALRETHTIEPHPTGGDLHA